jgi:uncharacterized membrane protein
LAWFYNNLASHPSLLTLHTAPSGEHKRGEHKLLVLFVSGLSTSSAFIVPLKPFSNLNQFTIRRADHFFLLFLLVVRNERIPHFIRFNTMQAILIDILVILCQVVAAYVLKPVIQIDFILQTLFTTVFLGVVATISYSIFQSVRGNYAEIPTLSDAVHMQVR